MGRYLVRRSCEMVITLFLIATATFFLLAAVPGNPIRSKLARFPEKVKQAMEKKYGFDKPVHQRYLLYMKQMLKGDFGASIAYPGQTMASVFKDKFPVSARLGIQQMLLGVSIGLLLGIIAALKRATWVDYTIVTIAIIFTSIPGFVFAIMIQKIFGGTLHWFPVIGWPSGSKLWFGDWKYTILPTLAGCFGYIAGYARLTKTSMLDVINQDYVLTAKSKGLSNTAIIIKHVLRNSSIPIVTVLPITVSGCISGSFVIERIFSIPGMGHYFIGAVTGKDVTMIMGFTVVFTIIYLITLLIIDILYTVVDPRIRITGGKR